LDRERGAGEVESFEFVEMGSDEGDGEAEADCEREEEDGVRDCMTGFSSAGSGLSDTTTSMMGEKRWLWRVDEIL
jgi:hypothetical protein